MKALLEGESEQGHKERLDMQVRFSGDLEVLRCQEMVMLNTVHTEAGHD